MHFLDDSNITLNTLFAFTTGAAIGIVIAFIIRGFLNNK